MIIIERKDDESIDRMVKRYKRKHRNLQIGRQLRNRKFFTKPSERRRHELLSAEYRLQEYGKH